MSTYNFPMEDGDIILPCSDGLTNMVSEETIGAVLQAPGSLKAKVEELVQLANEAGGLSNISVMLMRLNRPPTVLSRLLRH